MTASYAIKCDDCKSTIGHARYEVQFCDGSGAWRRWSLKSSREAATNSLAKLRVHLGTHNLGARIVEVRKP